MIQTGVQQPYLVVLCMVNFHNLAADSRFKLAVVVREVRQNRRGSPCRGRRGNHAPCGRDTTRSVARDSSRHVAMERGGRVAVGGDKVTGMFVLQHQQTNGFVFFLEGANSGCKHCFHNLLRHNLIGRIDHGAGQL